MKLKSWLVLYKQDEDGAWCAEFPGLEGCVTHGDTQEEVRTNAAEALSGYLLSLSSRRLLAEGEEKAEGERLSPSLPIALALTIREMRSKAGISQTEAAKRVGVLQPTYSEWEDPARCTPTAETIEKIARAFGRRVEIAFPEVS